MNYLIRISMKIFNFYLISCFLICCGSLTAQVKGFKTNSVRLGASYQISPFRISQTTQGGALDIVGFDGKRPTWYASLFYEGGSSDESGYENEYNRKDSFLGVKGGLGVGSILLYATGAIQNYSATDALGYYEEKSFDVGAGFKSFLGRKQNFTLGSEFSTNRILAISVGFLF